MPQTFTFWQLRKSPRRHSRQVLSWPPCQPTPTRWPFVHAETPAPTASTMPATSCPGTRGYSIPGQAPSLVSTSLWQTPHANTLIRTCPAPGVGISRSTIWKSAPGLGTCATFMVATAAVVVATNPPIDFQQVLESTLQDSTLDSKTLLGVAASISTYPAFS